MTLAAQATKARIAFRYYLWAEGRAYRITNRLHSDLLDALIRLPQFANSAQRIVQATVTRVALQTPKVDFKGSTYLFDGEGKLDLVDQVEAARGILGVEVKGNIVGIEDILARRSWQRRHAWSPPQEAIEQVLMDILPEQRTDNYKPLPMLKGVR